MPRFRLKQLAQDGATDGQLLRYNATADEWEPFTSAAGVFGTEYDLAESLAEVTETGQTYVEAFKYTTPSLPAGTYHVQFGFQFKSSTMNRAMGIRVQEDDTTTLYENIDVIIDSYLYETFMVERVLGAGTHDFDFDFRRVAAQASTASIQNMRVEIWRTV